jgi:hypothetical protein
MKQKDVRCWTWTAFTKITLSSDQDLPETRRRAVQARNSAQLEDQYFGAHTNGYFLNFFST